MSILRLMLQTSIAGHHSSRGQTLDREDGFQLLVVSVQEMMPLSLEEFTTWLQIHQPKLERGVHDVATDTFAETRKVVGKLDALVNLQESLASDLRITTIQIFSARNYAIVIRGVHDVATDTSAETRKEEGKLDVLVNLVTQLAVNQKPASVARVCGIRSSNDHHTNLPTLASFSGRNDAIVIRGFHDVATDISAKTRKVEGKLDALVNLATRPVARVCGIRSSNDHHTNQPGLNKHPEAYAVNIYSRPPQQGIHDVATETSVKTRKVEGKLDALVNLVAQLAVNQKPASIVRVLGHHNSRGQTLDREDDFQLLAVEVIRGVYDVATDTSAETRKVEAKLDALLNLVTQLAVNHKPHSVARVCGIRSSNDHHTNFSTKNDASVIIAVNDVATDTSAEARNVEGKLDALVNLVTQLAVHQKPAYVARVCGISIAGHHSSRGHALDREDGFQLLAISVQKMMSLSLEEFTTWLQIHLLKLERNDAIVIRGVDNVATDTSAETGKVEGKLDALVKMVTQLAVNQKPASVARATKAAEATLDREDGFQLLAVLVQEMMSFSLEEFTTWLQIHLLKLESIMRLMLQTSIAGDQSSRGQTHDREDGFELLAISVKEMMPFPIEEFTTWLHIHLLKLESFGARNDAIVIRGFHDLATDISAETRKVEGRLDDIVNLVTQIAFNQKPTSVARVYCIRSSNDHHTNVCPSSLQPRVNEHHEAYAANIYCRRSQQQRQDT
ncbi:hypothetical protein Fmac_024827 [Flemingia macrophylla]|uniref:Uncharacterized protein n=1 Tax=Flemingia macrophylla TaxID=520843 RepID=A0ABD1LQH4_9FABA